MVQRVAFSRAVISKRVFESIVGRVFTHLDYFVAKRKEQNNPVKIKKARESTYFSR